MKISVYSDGSATTVLKPGGWAYVLVVDGVHHSEGSGYSPGASNNDMELMASIQGLAAALKFINEISAKDTEVTLISDSQLTLGWASGTYRFKQESKIERYNQLRFLMNRLNAKTQWVEGHTGCEWNERCDKLANAARKQLSLEIEKKEAKITGESLIGTKKKGVLCVWYKNVLKVLDLDANIVENYNRDIHGPRGSALEIREEKSR